MIEKAVEDGLLAVDACLRRVVQTDVGLLREASEHIISSGGKRIRPRLVLLTYLAAGGQDLGSIVPLAAAVELVHTATLVHDDINDHSPTRRGKVAVHARWGRTFALLTGDYLFTKVYELMAPFGAQYNAMMAQACVRLVEGETLQAAAAKEGSIDRETYRQIIARKTASLFEAASRMGATLAGADEGSVNALAAYGHNLGLAFQIIDDILDVVGDPKTMGKPVGSDLAQGAGVLYANNGKKSGVQVAGDGAHDPIMVMMAQIRDSGALESARAQAYEIAGRARHALDDVPSSQAKDELHKLIDLAMDRQL